MKNFITPILLICVATAGYTQTTITSTQNGNWFMPTTWDCTCLPTPADEVIIDHNVTLDNNWLHSGILEVSPGAALTGNSPLRAISLDAAIVDVQGTFDVAVVAALDSADIWVDGTMTITTFYIDTLSAVGNAGTMNGMDSVLIAGEWLNDVTGTITADRVWNMGFVTNEGTATFDVFLNTFETENLGTLISDDFANDDTAFFYNSGSVIVNLDFWNLGDFENDTTGQMQVMQDWLNADSLNSDAYFYNDGLVEVYQDWSNTDEVEGFIGRFCVIMNTLNTGDLLGTFDLCDMGYSGPAPNVDINTGNIDPGITWCNTACTTSHEDLAGLYEGPTVYPNPTSGLLFVNRPQPDLLVPVTVHDLSGKLVLSTQLATGVNSIDVSPLAGGIYMVRIGQSVSKLVKN